MKEELQTDLINEKSGLLGGEENVESEIQINSQEETKKSSGQLLEQDCKKLLDYQCHNWDITNWNHL